MSGQSTLTAVVRDVNQQVVKNAVVYFEVVSDTSGGAGIAPGSVTTNSVGTAQAVYTAGPNATAQNGVTLHAYVPDPNPLNPPLAEDSVQLTVAQQALFISLGTGNDLFEPTTASFAKEWDIIVTDSVGAAVANKVVQVSLNSVKYYKGAMVQGMTSWGRGTEGVNYQSCNDEDTNRNGILDPPRGHQRQRPPGGGQHCHRCGGEPLGTRHQSLRDGQCRQYRRGGQHQ
ncbi:MAG: Ig-like domain-containing protein [Gammaproteobacteria bacterium]|nr:Ig-like domain-containing protein [Gammaproteobacteria bacterium]